MTRLHLALTAPWNGGYSSSTIDRWPLGEVREVADDQAAYLTSTFPEYFVEQGAVPATTPVASSPPPATDPPPGSDPSSSTSGPSSVNALVILEANVKTMQAELAAGTHDQVLDALESAEIGKGELSRKTVVAAIVARRNQLVEDFVTEVGEFAKDIAAGHLDDELDKIASRLGDEVVALAYLEGAAPGKGEAIRKIVADAIAARREAIAAPKG